MGRYERRTPSRGQRFGLFRRGQGGFTQVELVVALVLVGILAAAAIPRFVGRDAFDSRGFSDQFLAAIQFARQQAVAQRRQVCIAIAANGYGLTRARAPDAACDGTPVLDPVTGAAYVVVAPAGVAVAGVNSIAVPLTLSFNPLGRPNIGGCLQISADINRWLRIEAETGYVHAIASAVGCP